MNKSFCMCKSLESVGEMKDGTMNLSRRKQIN